MSNLEHLIVEACDEKSCERDRVLKVRLINEQVKLSISEVDLVSGKERGETVCIDEGACKRLAKWFGDAGREIGCRVTAREAAEEADIWKKERGDELECSEEQLMKEFMKEFLPEKRRIDSLRDAVEDEGYDILTANDCYFMFGETAVEDLNMSPLEAIDFALSRGWDQKRKNNWRACWEWIYEFVVLMMDKRKEERKNREEEMEKKRESEFVDVRK